MEKDIELAISPNKDPWVTISIELHGINNPHSSHGIRNPIVLVRSQVQTP